MATYLEQARGGDFPPPPIARTLGFALESVERGRATFRMETDPARHGNPMGTVHGGVLCDLADAAMGMAFASTLEEGESFTTVELKVNFLRPVWRATLTAVAEVLQRGRTVGLVECRVTDGEGRAVAHATSTCLTLRGAQADGR
ncbi:MAG: PaaI family thioesterase [Gemmatimonadaceae bacterium]